MKKIAWIILNSFRVGPPIQLAIKSGLKSEGWLRSYRTKKSEDRDGNPVAWYTYPTLHFLEGRLQDNLCVFEYGAGASTHWYAKRVKEVISVDHHKGWYEKVKTELAPNAQIRHVSLEQNDGADYANAARTENRKFDIVVIDGRLRVACAKAAVDALTEKGVIIFDNTDRTQYQEGYDQLRSRGFRQLPFVGMSPVSPLNSETSIFYREHNCLQI